MSEKTTIFIPYGKSSLKFSVPKGALIDVLKNNANAGSNTKTYHKKLFALQIATFGFEQLCFLEKSLR